MNDRLFHFQRSREHEISLPLSIIIIRMCKSRDPFFSVFFLIFFGFFFVFFFYIHDIQALSLFCNMGKMEDEFNFVLTCPAFLDIREKHIKLYCYNIPLFFKFVQLFSKDNFKSIHNPANIS